MANSGNCGWATAVLFFGVCVFCQPTPPARSRSVPGCLMALISRDSCLDLRRSL